LKRTVRTLPLLLVCLLFSLKPANAQIKLTGSLYYGVGTATDSASGPVNTLGGGTIYTSPSLDGIFETIGGDLTIRHGLGVGAEFSFRNSRGPYAGLSYRPEFYDVNAVYQPPRFLGRRFVPEFQGGVGRMVMNFYDTPQFCQTYFSGCRSLTGQISTVERMQIHAGGGVRFYVYKKLFIRPQIDLHYVRNLAEFSSSFVPQFTVSVGYTLHKGR
jgi:hypothetical protein